MNTDKILVTGATGFLGGRLSLRLASMGHEVTGVGRNETAGNALAAAGVNFEKADLNDSARILKLCEGMDFVFHCGAMSSPWGKYADFYAANVEGTKNVINGCMKNSVKRMLYVSTPSIYYNSRDRFGVKEDDPLPEKQVNFYSQTKLLAEKEVDAAAKSGLPVVTIRPRAIFGPGDNSIIPRLILANNRYGVPFINNGSAVLDVTYVENVVDSLLLCMRAPDSALGKKYNITNGTPVTLKELLEELFPKIGVKFRKIKMPYWLAYSAAVLMEAAANLTGREPAMTRYSVGLLARSMTLDISAAKKDLNYTAATSIGAGLRAFAAWWRENKHD